MSYTDEYYKALQAQQKKKKKNALSVQSNEYESGLDSYSQGYYNAIAERNKEREQAIDDIAPITVGSLNHSYTSQTDFFKSREKEDNDSGLDFFQKSRLFDDGYDFGDITKTILGTAGDVAVNAGKGLVRMGEGVADWMAHGVANIADRTGNDAYADALRESATESFTDRVFGGVDNYLDQASVLGRTSEAILEGVGQAGAIYATGGALGGLGLGATGTTAATTGLMYLSGVGSGIGEAYLAGATDEEAQIYGRISGFADAVSELLFGGLGKGVNALGVSKGLSSADDMLAKTVSNVFKGRLGKNLAEYGIKAGAEGLEEVIAGSMQALGKKMTYLSEKDLSDIIADENLLEQFVVGTFSSGIMQGGDVVTSTKGGRDFITNLTKNEQLVVDTEFNNRLQEATKDGKKLAKKQENELYEEVISDLDKGLISTDTIEGVLGGEDYKGYSALVEKETSLTEQKNALTKEIDALLDKPNPTIRDNERLAQARQELANIEQSIKGLDVGTVRSNFQQKMASIVKNDTRLHESFNERERRGQDLQLDVEKYTGAARTTAENLLKGGLNNTYKVRTLADMLTRISADKNVVFNALTAQKIAEAGLGVEGRTVNGVKTKDGIILNIESGKQLNVTVGHEITHTLEEAGHYDELAQAIKEYAELKGDYQNRYDLLESIYAQKDEQGNILKDDTGNTVFIRDDVNIDSEVVADLVGDYLFTDEDFINNLSTKHRNVFQKIFDEIKYLVKIATAGSEEARKLEEVKKKFEQAYRDGAEVTELSDGEVKYSIREEAPPKETGVAYKVFFVKDGKLYPPMVANPDGQDTPIGVWLNADVGTSAPPSKTGRPQVKAGGKGTQGGSGSLAFRPGWHLGDLPRASQFDRVNPETGKKELFPENFVWAEVEYAKDVDYQEEAMSYGYTENGKFRHAYAGLPRLPENGYYRYRTNPKPDTVPWVITGAMKVNRLLSDAEVNEILEKNGVAPVHRQGGDVGLDKFGFDESGAVKYSLSTDTEGRKLTNEQAEFFKDSKVLDENGCLKVVYHGTRNADFTVFKRNVNFFTDSREMADSYSPNGDMYEGYLNITKPYVIDAVGEKWSQIPVDDATKNFLQEYGASVFKENGKWRTTPADIASAIEEAVDNGDMDYDGVIIRNVDDTGSYYKGDDKHLATDYIVFKSNQFKNADNKAPTSNPDIRYSLSADSEGRELSEAVKNRFANTKVVDESGNLKVVYHGTASGEFFVFDKAKGSVEGDFGSGFYFTDNADDVSAHYEGGGPDFENKVSRLAEQIKAEEDITYAEAEKRARAELFKGSHKFDVYLNIENPAIVGETTLFDPDNYFGQYDENDYDSYEDYEGDVEQLVVDDVENIIWDIERNVDVDRTDGIAEILYNAFNEGGIDIEALKKQINELYLEDSNGNLVGNEVTRQIIESLGYDGIIDNTVSGKWNMDIEDGTTHYIVFKPNQIKSVTNENPTDNPDIRYSLSDSDGNTLSTEQQEYFKDSKLRDDNGNLLVMYHGSQNLGFTVFDPNASDDNRSFFFSDKPSVAASYSDSTEEIAPYEGDKTSGLYKTYLNLKNPYIVDARGSKWNNVVEFTEGDEFLSDIGAYLGILRSMDSSLSVEDFLDSVRGGLTDSTEYAIEELFIDEDTEESNFTPEEQNQLRELAARIDEAYNGWDEEAHIDEDGDETAFEDYVRQNYTAKTTRQIAKEAYKNGYDGVIFKNIVDVGKFANMAQQNYDVSTVAVAFDSSQIKSADNTEPTSNPDIRYSLSMPGEISPPYGKHGVYGWEAVKQDPYHPLGPTKFDNDAAPAPNVQTDAWEEYAPMPDNSPEAQLYRAEKAMADIFAQLNADGADPALQHLTDAEWAERTRIAGEKYEAYAQEAERLKAEIAEIENQRFANLDDADVPPEVEAEQDYIPDDVPLSITEARGLAQYVRSQLGFHQNKVGKVQDLISEYGKGKLEPWQLYNELKQNYGKYTEIYRNEELAEVKKQLRTYGVKVSDSIKREIPDYGYLQKHNFGKIRFSKKGLAVDEAYQEFQEVLPGYFPQDIISPTDQLWRMIEVANMEVETREEHTIDDETISNVVNSIIRGVNDFKYRRKEAYANEFSKASFHHLWMEAPKYMPPGPDSEVQEFTEGKGGQYEIYPAEEKAKPFTRAVLQEQIIGNIKSVFKQNNMDFDEVVNNAKRMNALAINDTTPQRVNEKTFGYEAGKVLNDILFNKEALNESAKTKWNNEQVQKLRELSKKHHIKPYSKESAAAQMYAEGFWVNEKDEIIPYGDAELAKDFPNVRVQNNIKGLAKDPVVRQMYDETLAMMNASRTANAYPEIPRLDNYFLHFRAMNDTFSQLGLPFNPKDIRAKDLPTDLNGVTADNKPGQPFFTSAMHREGKRTSFDLLGGLESYMASAGNQIFHIGDIQNTRAVWGYLADRFGQAHGLENLSSLELEEQAEQIQKVYDGHLSNYARFLNEYANNLAGKTALIDRGVEGLLGRRALQVLNTINTQTGRNQVGYSVSSPLTNFIPAMEAIARLPKWDVLKAFAQQATNVFRKDGFAENDPALIRRRGIDKFSRTPYEKVSDAGYVLMGAVDNITSEFIVRAKYNELVRKGMGSEQAHIRAGEWAMGVMGDRSLGQVPLMYTSKTLGMLTKYQLEVRNQLDSAFYDTIQEAKASTKDIENATARNAKTAAKITSKLFQIAVLNHIFGQTFEKIAGYNPAFDIISTIATLFGWDDEEDEKEGFGTNLEQAFQEFLGDLPYTSLITDGGRIPMASALPLTQLATGKDKYGNEKSRWETLGEALPYYILPGGYGQLKKTQKGLDMFLGDHPISGSYTDSGNLRFPVEATPWNVLQAGLFGQYASENARDYFDNNRNPLKEKQIQEFIDVDIPIADYWEYREGLAGLKTNEEKIDYIAGLDLPASKKNILANNVLDRKEPVDLTDYDDYSGLDEFDFATKNPGKYAIAEAVGGYNSYTKYNDAIKEIKDDNDSSTGVKDKDLVTQYIESLPLDYGEKILLHKSLYPKDDTYNYDIVEYLDSRDDISYEQMVSILEELGFKVNGQQISWD